MLAQLLGNGLQRTSDLRGVEFAFCDFRHRQLGISGRSTGGLLLRERLLCVFLCLNSPQSGEFFTLGQPRGESCGDDEQQPHQQGGKAVTFHQQRKLLQKTGFFGACGKPVLIGFNIGNERVHVWVTIRPTPCHRFECHCA